MQEKTNGNGLMMIPIAGEFPEHSHSNSGTGFGRIVCDIGCPSIYVLPLLVNEQSCFGQWLSRGKPGGKSEQR